VNLLRREIDRIGRQDAERDLNRPIVDAALDAVYEQAGQQTQSDASCGEPNQGQEADRNCRYLPVRPRARRSGFDQRHLRGQLQVHH
jgi:hypothetical protein